MGVAARVAGDEVIESGLCPVPGEPGAARHGYLRTLLIQDAPRGRPVRVSTCSAPAEHYEMLPGECFAARLDDSRGHWSSPWLAARSG